MKQNDACTCPVHGPATQPAGRRSVGVMIRSPQKQMKNQAVQTSFENDVNDYTNNLNGTPISMIRSHLHKAESNLLETGTNINGTQEIITLRGQQDVPAEEVVFTKTVKSDLHALPPSGNSSQRPKLVSDTQKQLHAGETENSDNIQSELDLIDNKFPSFYESLNNQNELIMTVEIEEMPFLLEENAKFSDVPLYDVHVREQNYPLGLEHKIEITKHSVLKTNITQIEFPKMYERTHFKTGIRSRNEEKAFSKNAKSLVLKHKEIFTDTHNGLNNQLDINENNLTDYVDPKFYNEDDLIMEFETEDMLFEQAESPELNGLNQSPPKEHVPETEIGLSSKQGETDEAIILEPEIKPVKILKVFSTPNYRDMRLEHGMQIQRGRRALMKNEVLSNHYNTYETPKDQREVEEKMHVDKRKFTFLHGVPNALQEEPIIRSTEINFIFQKINVLVVMGSRTEHDTVIFAHYTSQIETKSTAATISEVAEVENVPKYDLPPQEMTDGMPQTNSETQNSFYAPPTQALTTEIKLHVERTRGEVVNVIGKPNSLHHSYQAMEAEFSVQTKATQTHGNIRPKKTVVEESRLSTRNVHRTKDAPFPREMEQDRHHWYIKSAEVAQNEKPIVQRTPRNELPSFIVTKTPSSKHDSSATKLTKPLHSNKGKLSHANVPSHGGVFLAGREHVAIFSQSRVTESRPEWRSARHEELTTESDSSVTVSNRSLHINTRPPWDSSFSAPKFNRVQHATYAGTLQQRQTSLPCADADAFMTDDELSARTEALTYSHRCDQSRSVRYTSGRRTSETDCSVLEVGAVPSRRQAVLSTAHARQDFLTSISGEFSPEAAATPGEVVGTACHCCHHCVRHRRVCCQCASTTPCGCVVAGHLPQHVIQNFFLWPAMVTHYTWRLNKARDLPEDLKSLSRDVFSKPLSTLTLEDMAESCHCKEVCQFMSPIDGTAPCPCKDCAKRTLSPFQLNKASQFPPVENRGVQTDEEPVATKVDWMTESAPPMNRSAEEAALYPLLTAASEYPMTGCEVPPHEGCCANCRLQLVVAAGGGSLPLEDFKLVLVPKSNAKTIAPRPPSEFTKDASLVTRPLPSYQAREQSTSRKVATEERSKPIEREGKYAPKKKNFLEREDSEVVSLPQQPWRYWMFYIIAAVTLSAVLLCLTPYLYQPGAQPHASSSTIKALICSSCALVIVLSFYVVWAGCHTDDCRGHKIVVMASAVGLVAFTVVGVLTVLESSALTLTVFLFLIAAIFLSACAHSAITLYRLVPCGPVLPT